MVPRLILVGGVRSVWEPNYTMKGTVAIWCCKTLHIICHCPH